MKLILCLVLGIIVGLLLPYVCGRSISINVTHEFRGPVKGVKP